MNSLRTINLVAYSSKTIDEEELKYMIDSSIYGVFGVLEANKIKYSVKSEGKCKYVLKTYEKYYIHIQTYI